MNKIKTIEVDYVIKHLCDWIKDYFADNGPKSNAIIGISGGKDSTIAAALLVRALGADRVIGVLMPNGEQADIEDARRVCKVLGIRSHEINIENIVDATYQAIGYGDSEIDGVKYNTPPRIRMTILYAMASLYNGRVVNTSNQSEIYIGWCSKFGDTAGDFSLFHNLTVTELLMIANACEEIPKDLVYKTPSDGMCGMTDEEKFGFTYKELDNYILNEVIPDYDKLVKIKEMHKRALHKSHAINLPHPNIPHTFIDGDTGAIIENERNFYF